MIGALDLLPLCRAFSVVTGEGENVRSVMINYAVCLKCGAPLNEDARDGVCPKCLLGQARRNVGGLKAHSPEGTRTCLVCDGCGARYKRHLGKGLELPTQEPWDFHVLKRRPKGMTLRVNRKIKAPMVRVIRYDGMAVYVEFCRYLLELSRLQIPENEFY